MASFRTRIFLALGDTLVLSGSDYLPSSGDYVDLSSTNKVGPMTLEDGLIIPSYKEPPDNKKAGAMIRIRSVRPMPIKTITLHMIIFSAGNDASTVFKWWSIIEQKLEQAAAASGPMGHGTQVCLLVRMATTGASSGLGGNFVAYDVLGGTMTPNDLLTNPGVAYGATLELRCLPFGRLTAQTYPSVGTYTTTIGAGLTSFLYVGGNPFTTGPIPGTVGALPQLHILDKSTAGAINALYVGRRAVNAAGGGMASADWTPVVGLLSSPATHVSDANTVGTFHAELVTADNTTWHNLGIITTSAGADPKYQAGVYDVLLRVRELQAVAPQYYGDALGSGTLSAGKLLIPDTYNVCVAYNDGTLVGAASPALSTTAGYGAVWPPNTFYDDFETGDVSQWITVSSTSSGAGDISVASSAAIAGTFGVRIRLSAVRPSDSTTKYYPPDLMQLIKPISLPVTNQPVRMSCWMYINGGCVSANPMFLGGLSSSAVEYAMSRETPPPGTGTLTGNGVMGGYLAALVVTGGNQLEFATFNDGSPGGPSLGVLTSNVNTIVNKPLWVEITLPSGALSGGYTASVRIVTPTTTLSITNQAGTLTGLTGGPTFYVDRATIGLSIQYGSGAADIFYDDVMVHTAASVFPLPNQGIYIVGQIGVSNLPTGNFDIYVQRNNAPWQRIAHPNLSGAGALIDFTMLGNFASPPATPTPSPSYFRARLDVKNATGNAPIVTDPVPTDLQNNQWHLINLGTLTLPPISKFEGFNPSGGSGAGDFGWQMIIEGLAGAATSNTLSVDCAYLLPHDEPQIYVEYPGLNNVTLYEWVMDGRRDGRGGAVVRDAATQTNVLQMLAMRGHMQLAVGNQKLVIIPLREGGVHDVQHTQYQVQLRWQSLVDFIHDDPTVY